MLVEICCPCGFNGRTSVAPLMWEETLAWVSCPDCGETLTQHGNNLQMLHPEMPVSVGFLACTGLGKAGRVLAVSRKDDHTQFGVPGGKVDPEDGSLAMPEFVGTVKRAVARELGEEAGVRLPAEGFRIVHQGVCPGGKDGIAYWQVTLTYDFDDDWVAETQPGEGVVAWVPWETLEGGPFGTYNRKLRAALYAQQDFLDPSTPIAEVDEYIREHGGDPEAIGRRGADLVRELIEEVRGEDS